MARLSVKRLAELHQVSRAIVYVWVEERRFPVLSRDGAWRRILLQRAIALLR